MASLALSVLAFSIPFISIKFPVKSLIYTTLLKILFIDLYRRPGISRQLIKQLYMLHCALSLYTLVDNSLDFQAFSDICSCNVVQTNLLAVGHFRIGRRRQYLLYQYLPSGLYLFI